MSVMDINGLLFIDKTFSILKCPHYNNTDKQKGLFNLFNRYRSDLFNRLHLFKYATSEEMSLIEDVIIDVIVTEQYELFKEFSHSILLGFYKIQAVILRFSHKDVMSRIKAIWQLDFDFYQRSIKNSVNYMIKNLWTGWDTAEGRLLVLQEYFSHYKKYYGNLTIWKSVEELFEEAFEKVKKEVAIEIEKGA